MNFVSVAELAHQSKKLFHIKKTIFVVILLQVVMQQPCFSKFYLISSSQVLQILQHLKE